MDHINIGKLGEEISCDFLEKKGYVVIGRNFRKKFGEIDIIAKKSGTLLFVEVKSTEESGSLGGDGYRPEEHVTGTKLKRLSRTVQIYLSQAGLGVDSLWEFAVISVVLDEDKKIARVKMIADVLS
ncbi:MAG: hypothetical protein A2664_01100 [Candidatus Taylorbacteria bacterium RIFCSPHIGHO2_01_FULL_46_22b]|uniref:UPF0102 protein A2664_01100 n=1 Tax=Candidatus Taylorbacteria bacterium RIFCSPHIGHO2_01_FULL_46_22b TaxID=1802301 RepID=A0A1G2M216_9BACT|nr:MAG: hypothetical protein A2664_01100 [Candidatus Taylorbacteria bacterium RIFCSPHIGHO2_01_FULL_46_22b]